jgi:hypothetical protein
LLDRRVSDGDALGHRLPVVLVASGRRRSSQPRLGGMRTGKRRDHTECTSHPHDKLGGHVIVLGLILVLLGMFLDVPPILTTIGIILIIVGAILWILGAVGRQIGPRRYYY